MTATLSCAVARLQAPASKGSFADTEAGGAGGVHGILGAVSERSVPSSAPLLAPPQPQPGGSCSFPPAAHRRLSKAREWNACWSRCSLLLQQSACKAAGLTSVVTHSSRLGAGRGRSRLPAMQLGALCTLLWQKGRPVQQQHPAAPLSRRVWRRAALLTRRARGRRRQVPCWPPCRLWRCAFCACRGPGQAVRTDTQRPQ